MSHRSSAAAFLVLLLPAAAPSQDATKVPSILYDYLATPVSTFDPHRVFDLVAGRVQLQIYETLYEMEWGTEPFKPVPCLAAALPNVGEDRKTYEIKIKSGVFFQDDACFEGGK